MEDVIEEDIVDHNIVIFTGEKLSITDRLEPEVPAPHNSVENDSDGWSAIDRVGAWDAYLCEFQVLEEVPAQHRSMWARAWEIVLQKIQESDSGKNLDRGLMWLCFLPKGLLRQAKRGGKAGRN